MTDKTENSVKAAKAPAAEIIRGRMPLAMVFAIRFLEEGNDSEIANKYRTTPGKVNDIKKSRNFAYVTEGTRFTQEQLDQAQERAALLEDDADEVSTTLNGMTVATEAETAEFEASRKVDRKPRGGKKAKKDDSSEAEPEAEDDVSEEDLDDLLG